MTDSWRLQYGPLTRHVSVPAKLTSAAMCSRSLMVETDSSFLRKDSEDAADATQVAKPPKSFEGAKSHLMHRQREIPNTNVNHASKLSSVVLSKLARHADGGAKTNPSNMVGS
eukprot:SAG31_NODE_1742_length_7385_cov_40.678836_1_plen_113_part_00